MKIAIAPKEALAPTLPAVGIFWRVENVLVVDRSTLDNAESYCDCLTHTSGHNERWSEWQARGCAGWQGWATLVQSHQPSTMNGHGAGLCMRYSRFVLSSMPTGAYKLETRSMPSSRFSASTAQGQLLGAMTITARRERFYECVPATDLVSSFRCVTGNIP